MQLRPANRHDARRRQDYSNRKPGKPGREYKLELRHQGRQESVRINYFEAERKDISPHTPCGGVGESLSATWTLWPRLQESQSIQFISKLLECLLCQG